MSVEEGLNTWSVYKIYDSVQVVPDESLTLSPIH